MQLDFTNLFNGSNEVINIDYVVNLENLVYSTYNPIKNGATVIGKSYNRADVVYLELKVSFNFKGVCDRCAEEVIKDYSFEVNKIVVPQLSGDDDDDNYIVLENNILNVDDYINEETLLFLPQKMLCSDDCKGLCPKCGANLNFEKCDCKKDVDPRMEVLLQLLDED